MRPEGDCWPTSQQRLLLRAALLEGSHAIETWNDWKRGIILDRLDRGSIRLLPLLYHNLS